MLKPWTENVEPDRLKGEDMRSSSLMVRIDAYDRSCSERLTTDPSE